jgi:hypothetical protein
LEIHTRSVGLLEVRAAADIVAVDTSLVIDFGAQDSDFQLELNGRRLTAGTPASLADKIAAQRRAEASRVIAVPYEAAVEGRRLVLSPGSTSRTSPVGAYLSGPEAQAAVDKAWRVVESSLDAWPAAPTGVDPPGMGGLVDEPQWNGPLVVAMPRTGSTLLGILFLFCRSPGPGDGHRFDRYVHEPVAPVFWRGDDVSGVAEFIRSPRAGRDVVQESAYQFTYPQLAKWFLSRARQPVVFTMRHPQLAWPSRWRAMLAKAIAEQPEAPDAEALQVALDEDDFSGLGDYLTERVRPSDNGFYAFMSLIDMCVQEGIEFVIIDNTRFRDHPEPTLRDLCGRLGIDFDPAMTTWTSLEPVLPRVVMSDLALGDEYQWYYAGTLGSVRGIEPETHKLVDPGRFPEALRGVSDQHLTIDEAVTWHQLLLSRPETLS